MRTVYFLLALGWMMILATLVLVAIQAYYFLAFRNEARNYLDVLVSDLQKIGTDLETVIVLLQGFAEVIHNLQP
jgi:hypothetical protein